MASGAQVLTRAAAALMPPRADAMSFDDQVACIQGAPLGEVIVVTWSTPQDATWHSWTGTIRTVVKTDNGTNGSIKVLFTDVQRDLEAHASQSAHLDLPITATTFIIPGTDLYIKSIRIVANEDGTSPEAVAALVRRRSVQRTEKRTKRAEAQQLQAALAAAQAETAQAQVRASSEAAAAAQTGERLNQAAAANEQLYTEYNRGEGLYAAALAELEAAKRTIVGLRQQLGRSPSPILPMNGLPTFSPIAAAPAARATPLRYAKEC